jgi:mannan endo-1,4-beta-mannosidase
VRVSGSGDGGSPSATAGGVLSGSYPNPGFAVDMATQAELGSVQSILQSAITSLTVRVAALETSGASSPAQSFVTRSGSQLMLNGVPYHFTGINIYNANSVNNYWYTLGTGSGLDQALADIGSGIDVIRAWFGQWLLKPTGNTVDWGPFDHTVARVKAAGKRLIVVFADQDGTWDDGISKTLTSNWYQSGYKTVISNVTSSWGAVNTMTYKDFVLAVVNRYKTEPAVMMWQLVNECETKLTDGSCSTATDDAGATALRAFADDMSTAIKAIDTNHLISLGTIGSGQCGTSGSRYLTVHEPVNIDLCEMHDYVPDQNVFGDQFNGMAVRLQQAATLGKPLFIGESGLDPSAVGGTSARATRYLEKWGAQFAAGVVGEVAWEWRNAGQTGGDPYVIPAGDPAINSLRISNYTNFGGQSTFTASTTLYNFDSTAQGWVGDGSPAPTVTRATSPTIDGAGVLAATKTLGTGFDNIKVNDAGQIPDDISANGLTVAAKVLVPSGAPSAGWNAHIEVQDSTFTWIAQSNVPLTPGTVKQLIWTPPAGLLANCRAIGVVFEETGANTTQTVYVDSIQQGSMS